MGYPWSFHTRNGVIYVQFKNEQTGKYTSARSTGKTDKAEALLVAVDWWKNGIPEPGSTRRRSTVSVLTVDAIVQAIRSATLTTGDAERILSAMKSAGLVELAIVKGARGSELVGDFLTRFWTYNESPYVKEKHAHGQNIGRRHCLESLHRVNRYWISRFEGKHLGEVSKSDLKSFGKDLAESGLAAGSVNKIIVAGTTAIRWAVENDLIETDPTSGLMRYSETPKKRGVLSPDEAKALFSVDWYDERARVANLVAAVTGLRAGEVRALQVRDIGDDRLYVRHSWSDQDGLKTPKNGEERVVPLFPAIRDELLELARTNPFGLDPERFIFYSIIPAKPCDISLFLDGLKDALILLDVGKTRDERKRERAAAKWKARNIVFHSWRHFYAARLADRIELRKVQLATGHKSAVMAEHYAEHALDSDFQAVGAAVGEAFGNIVPFRKAAGGEA